MQNNLAETAGISALTVLLEHRKIAFAHSGQLRDGWMTLKDFESLPEEVKAVVQEVNTKQVKRKTQDGEDILEEMVRIKTYDKQKSLEAIATMLGFNAPAKSEITGKDGADLFMSLMKAATEK